MKYRDPETGEFKDITVKVADTLPVGTIVEYDGTTIPNGWELVDESGTYKKIKKTATITATNGNIVDSLNGNSTTDAPSINAVNNKFKDFGLKTAVELFSGSSKDDITLNDNLSNYEYIDVYFSDGFNCSQIKRFRLDGSTITLHYIAYDTQQQNNWGVVNSYKMYKIENNMLKVRAYNRIYKYESGSFIEDRQNDIYVYKIVGYK